MTTVHHRQILAGFTLAALVTGGLGAPAYADPTGTVLGVGSDARGQLDVPASLEGSTVTGVAAGDYFSVALTDDGHVTAWGDDHAGQTDVPTSLADQDVTAVAAGGDHALALTDTGTVVPWGESDYGLDDVPASLEGQTVSAIAAGAFHSLAVADGHVVGWGYDDDHQAEAPAALEGKTVTAVAAGRYHSLALTSDGEVVGWGANWARQAEVPAALTDQKATAIAARGSHSLALTEDGTVVAWGSDEHHESEVPAELEGKTVVAIAAGYFNSVALTSDGQVVTWGGDSGQVEHPLPDAVVTAVAGGGFHTLAVTGEVAPNRQLSVTGSASVSGTPRVGETLEATDDVATTPHATLTRTWLRDGEATDVHGPSYLLTDDDLGHALSYRVSATKPGYDDAERTSEAIGPIGGGQLTLPAPTVSGDPVVDSTLTASVTGATEGATVTYTWRRGDDVVGTDATYTPVPQDLGHTLTVTAAASKENYDGATSSTESDEIAAAAFASGPEATISGQVKVGQTLTVDEGTVSPAQDSFGYQWYADGARIAGATGRTYRLTGHELHANISVEVTATKAGYADATDASDATAAVIDHGPGITLSAGSKKLRRGQATTLTWTAADARSLTTSRNWKVVGLTGGRVVVRPTALGTTTYVLTGTDGTEESGTAQVSIVVTREAKKLPVAASTGRRKLGSKILVTASRLDAGEAYTIKLGTTVWSGKASSTGTVRQTVTIPRSVGVGTKTITVTGSEKDRVGTTTVRVVRR